MGFELYWVGDIPQTCDICSKRISMAFVDGKTSFGPWANMCITCHSNIGFGLGPGAGQMYMRQKDGRFKKVPGAEDEEERTKDREGP